MNINQGIFLFLFVFLYNINNILCGIKVAQPDELANHFANSNIEAVYGDFNNIDLGFEALGSVWIMPRDLRSPNDVPADYACNSLSNIKIIRDKFNYAEFNIVLVEKGPCSFPKMAMEVQKIGGDMILIVNNEPGHISNFKITDDDGRGDEITIPIAMISYNDGKAIIDYILNHPKENVYLNVEIGLNKKNRVKVDIFTNVLDIDTFNFLGKFQSYYNLLSNYINLNIYYLTPKMEGLLQSQKLEDCLKDGLYCMNGNLNPKNQKLSELKGIEIIYESLFHQCIFEKSKKTYFNFIEQYTKFCLSSDQYTNFCGLSLFNSGMKEIIMDCVFNSFGNSDYKKEFDKPQTIVENLNSVNMNVNTILVSNRLKESKFNIKYFPDIYINDLKYTGSISSIYLFTSICEAFSPKPEPCSSYALIPTNLEKEGIPWYEVYFILVFILFINLVIYYCIRKTIVTKIESRIDLDKNDLSGEINSVINSYFSLKEMENRNSSEVSPTNDLGDIQHFMSDEGNDNNQIQQTNQPGSKLIMSNQISISDSKNE